MIVSPGPLELQLGVSIQAKHVSAVQGLIRAGADPNAHIDGSGAAVHLAANSPQMLAELLNLGGDVNLKAAATGNTPLHIAAQNGNTACVRICLANGANIKARNHLGVTPRDVVRRRSRAQRWWAPVDSAYYLDNLERINESRLVANSTATMRNQDVEWQRQQRQRQRQHQHQHRGAGDAAALAWRSPPPLAHHATFEGTVPSLPPTPTSAQMDSGYETGDSPTSCNMASPCDVAPRDPLSLSKLPGMMAEMFDCSVCLDVMEDPITLPCGHTCCRGCIELMKHHSENDWFECPLDRARIPKGFPLRTSVILKQMRHVLSNVSSSGGSKPASPRFTSFTSVAPVHPASG